MIFFLIMLIIQKKIFKQIKLHFNYRTISLTLIWFQSKH